VPHKLLLQRKYPHSRFYEFPQMKGRTVEKIEFSSMPDFHNLMITFTDKTSLNLIIEPYLLIDSHFSDTKNGDQRILKRWPTIRSMMNRD